MNDEALAQRPANSDESSSVARGIFVSYRRRDSQGTTGRLSDGLDQAFGKTAVFRDIGAIRPGMNFVAEIEDALASSVVVLAVIGPNWLSRLRSFGTLPTDGPVDYLRWEIKTALVRHKLVIPVLVDGAEMPADKDLPDELKTLALLQCHELTDRDWEHDLRRLTDELAPRLQRPVPAGSASSGLNRWVAAATVFGILGIAGVGLFAFGIDGAPALSLDASMPAFIVDLAQEHAADGGTALLGGGLLMAVLMAAGKLLLGKYQEALGGRVGSLLSNGHVLAVVSATLSIVALMLSAGRVVLAVGVVIVAAAYLAARRWVPARLVSTRGSSLAAAGAVGILACALWADIAIDRDRQATFDVAFLLPPEGGGDVAASQRVFAEVNHALRVALKDAANIEIVPDRLIESDFRSFSIFNKQALLAKKGRKGYARVFIRVKYSLDLPADVERIAVSPYLRGAGKVSEIRALDDWNHEAIAGKDKSPLVALQASFELLSFLWAKGVLRLEPAEIQQVWRNVLDEYGDDLALEREQCPAASAAVGAARRKSGNLNADDLRGVLFASCSAANPSVAAGAPSNQALNTAVTPYAALAIR